MVKLGHVFKDFPLHMEDHYLLANLLFLTMKKFDLTLGIDWLMKYFTKLDYSKKRISFSVLGG